MKNQLILKLFLATLMCCLTVPAVAQEAVPFTPRLEGANIRVKGGLKILSNNILNTTIVGPIQQRDPADPANVPHDPNTAFNTKGINQNMPMAYIDIDDDSTTFSSSSATLNVPSCSRVVYAGLYWGGAYPFNVGFPNLWNNNPQDPNRDQPYEWAKFKVPGGSYVDIGPDSDPIFKYERIYDKEGDLDKDGLTDPGLVDVDINHVPYLNYADVTHLLATLGTNPSGTYTVANVVGTTALKRGGGFGGWTLVIVYESPNSTSKYISTYDGFNLVTRHTPPQIIDFSDFRTLPNNLPVRAKVAISAMEGDGSSGGELHLKAASTPSNATPYDGFTRLSNAVNPARRIFNSTISDNNAIVSNRIPASTNTLGWDTDVFQLNNPLNSVLPNNETTAQLRTFTTAGDSFYLFLNAIAVEIIEPEITLKKTVEDLAGNDITNKGVTLGQTVDYILRFQNIGNDNAVDYTIKDVLPANTSFVSVDLNGVPGGSSNYDPIENEILFTIPNELVEIGDPEYEIRLRVKISENCTDFVDACSHIIENRAFSTYTGQDSKIVVNNDLSFPNIDTCGFIIPGATNFLLDDISNCGAAREVQLCGSEVVLTAGSDFDTYTWYRDIDQNNQIDATDIVIADADSDNDPKTMVINSPGRYIVDKKASAPCIDAIEIINVSLFGSVAINPILNLFQDRNSDADPNNDLQGEIARCAIDGDQLPKLFLCGANDSEVLEVNITDAQSLVWEKLDENSCAEASDDCANKNLGCAWNPVVTGTTFNANAAGKFRLVIQYQNGCSSRFYFDVFKNELDLKHKATDIICETAGKITITSPRSGYAYQLFDVTNNTIVTPYSANSGPEFTINDNGIYRVQLHPLDPNTNTPIEGACEFSTPDIGIRERNFKTVVTPTAANCGKLGKITVQVNDVEPNYTYELRLNDGTANGTLVDSEVARTDNTYTFDKVNPNDYIVIIKTDNGCEDRKLVTVDEVTPLTLTALTTQHIGCTSGTITLTGKGGVSNPVYSYAIWSKDGVPLYGAIEDIPGSAFQDSPVFSFGYDEDGTYVPGDNGSYRFLIVDGSNCSSLSNTVTINDNGQMRIAVTDNTASLCGGMGQGSITIAATSGTPPYRYSIDNGDSYTNTPNFVNLRPGSYSVKVLDMAGCEETLTHTIDLPLPLSASAGITKDASCDSNGAEVRITNVSGGVAPYEYSFNGSTFGTSNSERLPEGDHVLSVRDANGCEFPIRLHVDGAPKEPKITATTAYQCDGNATVTANVDNTDYDYTYELNGVPNTPDSSNNVFKDLAPGSHTITVNYTPPTPSPSLLLSEDFGAGATVPSLNTVGYTYFSQQSGAILPDGSYTVTSTLVNPFQEWINPTDHTGLAEGRYLVMNVGDVGVGQALYKKQINDILPNKPLEISLWGLNLIRAGAGDHFLDPTFTIELWDTSSNTLISTATTNSVPKNEIWNEFTLTFDPGSRTSLELVLRTEVSGISGNDLALDDLKVYQVPEVCSLSVDLPLLVVANKGFAARSISSTNISCNGLTDGTVTVEVLNFNLVDGYAYSVDGGTTYSTPQKTSPITISGLSAGTNTIEIRDVGDPQCKLTLTQEITQPTALEVSASVSEILSCNNNGATVSANATGGNPAYEYQLETTTGTVVKAYTANAQFQNVVAGSYYVRVKDANGCEDRSDTALTIAPAQPVAFTAIPTSCYSGANDASIQLNVTSGSGGYQFRINNGVWVSPTPSTAGSFTFGDLVAGTYTIEVKDSSGCVAPQQSVTIQSALRAQVTTKNVTSCNDGNIDVSASGGDGNLSYAFVPTGTDPTGSFGSTSSFAVTAANVGTYDVYVRDNTGATPYCETKETVTVTLAPTMNILANATSPECHDGTGSITITITSGDAPYSLRLIDLDNGGAANETNSALLTTTKTYYNLAAGKYTITATDKYGCSVTVTPVTLNNPIELTADIEGKTPSTCTGDINDFGIRFSNYPTALGTLQFSLDGGTTWTGNSSVPGVTDILTGYVSGTTVYPSMRTVDGSGNTLCQTDFQPEIVPYPLDNLDITVSAIVVNCNELQVSVQGSEGTPDYQYTYSDNPANFNDTSPVIPWTTPATGASKPHVFKGLTPGKTYAFYVRDAAGCVRQSNVNVNDLIQLPVAISATSKPSCSNADNGEIIYTLTDSDGIFEANIRWELYDVTTGAIVRTGEGPYNPIPFQTIAIPHLAPASYYLKVTEVSNGGAEICTGASENLILQELDAISASPTVQQNIACNSPGLISIADLTGGGDALRYTVTGPAGFTTINKTAENPIKIPANSPSGSYSISAIDEFGCTADLGSVSLTLSPSPSIDKIAVTNCHSSATVTITASSTATQVLYSLNGGVSYENNGGVFTNVDPGNYTVSILDGNGCTATATAVVHPILEASVALTKLLDCSASPNAEITLNISSGSGSYAYAVSNSAGTLVSKTALASNTLVISAATADDYTITLFDIATTDPECSRSFTVSAPSSLPPVFMHSSKNASCNGTDNGSITLVQSDTGIGPLTYSILPIAGTFNNGTSTFENLPPNTYTVTATGTNGCITAIDDITITEPMSISVPTPTVTEFACTSDNLGSNASISINSSGITGGSNVYTLYEFINNQGTPSTADDVVVQRGTNTHYVETDKAGGNYTIRVYDSNGCSATASAVILAFDELLSVRPQQVEAISCSNAGEDVRIIATGTQTNSTANPASYEYRLLPNGSYQTSNVFNDLAVGHYTFEVRNIATGCRATALYTVAEPNTFSIAVDKIRDVVCRGTETGELTIELNDTSYSGAFGWTVFNTNGTPTNTADDTVVKSGNSSTTGPTASINLFAGQYRVEVVHHTKCVNTKRKNTSRDKWAHVYWANDIEDQFTTEIVIRTANEPGVLALVASTISEEDSNIENIVFDETLGSTTTLTVLLTVKDRVHLASIMRTIKNVPQVNKVKRKL